MDAITDLFSLTLVDGLPTQSEGRELRYRKVKLRETNVGDEREAERLAERVMMVNGKPTLLVSDSLFRFALTMRHVESFTCDGQMVIAQPLIDLELMGKLSSHDLGLIEARVFLISLAAEVRYGTMTQADFDRIVAGGEPPGGPPAPQRQGQAAGLGQAPAQPGLGPQMLADFAGTDSDRPPAGDGG